ncbi:MAG: hypothetical protein RL742_869 [Bacteroidota bacterium]
MSLLLRFSDSVTLTADQRAAAQALEAFIADPEARTFILRGYAGTGKTFLMQGVAAWLQTQARTVVFAAPTNRAAKVLQSRTGTPVLTLHKLLYTYRDKQHVLAPRPAHFGANPVLVVDEASLLGDATSDKSEIRFGSGKLLTDLFEFLNLQDFPETRIIFVGDPAQLPPVGMYYSPALSENNLRRLSGRPVRGAALSEVVRQQADNGILRVAHAMRGAIEGREFEPRLPLGNNREVQRTNGSRWMERYFEVSNGSPSGRRIILAYSNEDINACNRAVRAHFFPDAPDRLCQGEMLLVTNNVPGLTPALTNGELVKVLQCGELEKREVRIARNPNFSAINSPFLQYTDTQAIGTFHFRDVQIAVRGADGQPCTLWVKLLENWLFSERQEMLPFVASYMLRRIAQDQFYAKNATLYRRDNAQYRVLCEEYVRQNPYANAVCARFGYAITCHKAQGGEWDEVFVDMKAPMSRDTSNFYRWAYTAVTRARRRVFLRMNARDPQPQTPDNPGKNRPHRAGAGKFRRYNMHSPFHTL